MAARSAPPVNQSPGMALEVRVAGGDELEVLVAGGGDQVRVGGAAAGDLDAAGRKQGRNQDRDKQPYLSRHRLLA